MKFKNVGLKRSISCDSQTPSMILVFSTCEKNLSSQFFDLDIENPLGRGTLAIFDPPLYIFELFVEGKRTLGSAVCPLLPHKSPAR